MPEILDMVDMLAIGLHVDQDWFEEYKSFSSQVHHLSWAYFFFSFVDFTSKSKSKKDKLTFNKSYIFNDYEGEILLWGKGYYIHVVRFPRVGGKATI